MSRYVATDWHGQYQLAKQILDYLKPDDELYFLGDAIDRGPHGLKIMSELLLDKRVTYLRGNHEDIMLDCLTDMLDGHYDGVAHWLTNGGLEAFQQLEFSSEETKVKLIRDITRMPQRIDLVNEKGQTIILTHAGLSPWYTEEDMRLMGRKYPYIWDRKHLHDCSHFDKEEYKDTYIIHGHTPVEYLKYQYGCDTTTDEKETIITYSDGHKIDLDLASFATGRAALFDLDTFEVVYFEAEVE